MLEERPAGGYAVREPPGGWPEQEGAYSIAGSRLDPAGRPVPPRGVERQPSSIVGGLLLPVIAAPPTPVRGADGETSP